jgi:hypothetical protein
MTISHIETELKPTPKFCVFNTPQSMHQIQHNNCILYSESKLCTATNP